MTEKEQTDQYYKNNFFLLEADIKEEIQSLTEEIERKKKTRKDILDLPKKISYDCMVPLSKVAFSPGRLVHTNEFNVEVDAKTGARQWMSHVEAAEFLQNEVDRINGNINELRKYLESQRAGKSDNNSLVKERTSVKKQSVSSTGHHKSSKLEENANKDEYIPYADELTQYPNDGPSDDESLDGDEIVANREGFEIREYCDVDGNVLDSQVVDLSAELSQVQKQHREAKENTEAGGPPKQDVEKLMQDVNDKLKLPDTSEPVELNQDALFIRDLAELSSKKTARDRGCEELDSLFEKLERQEKEAESSREAAGKGLFSSSKWKKGFLSSEKGNIRLKNSKKVSKEKDCAIHPKQLEENNLKVASFNERSRVNNLAGDNRQVKSARMNGEQSTKTELHNQDTKAEIASNISSSAQDIIPSTTKKRASRFKQSRQTSESSVPNATSTIPKGPYSSVPFTGRIVEK